jgi:hypothetical protein
MRFIFIFPFFIFSANALCGFELLNGIKQIIGADPNLPRNEIDYKPFSGSFSSIKSVQDPNFNTTCHCMTDNACGHFEAYSRSDVPLYLLDCNKFCYIDSATLTYKPSDDYSINHPPKSYLNCGWETCN